MKKLILIMLLIVASQISKSQDLIVTTNNDSINCQLIEKKGSFYVYKVNVEGKFQNRAVKEDFVRKTVPGYYLMNPETQNKLQNKPQKLKYNEGTFGIIGVNYSTLLNYTTGQVPSDLKDFMNDLETGVSFSAEFDSYFSSRFSFGIRYELFMSDAQKNNLKITNTGSSGTYYFDIEEKLFLHSISPKISYRVPIKNEKEEIVFSGLVDYNIFKDVYTAEENSTSYAATGDVKGQKIGFGFGAAYEFIINSNFKIGLNSNYRFGYLDKVKINGEDEVLVGSQEINLTRFNVGISLAFR